MQLLLSGVLSIAHLVVFYQAFAIPLSHKVFGGFLSPCSGLVSSNKSPLSSLSAITPSDTSEQSQLVNLIRKTQDPGQNMTHPTPPPVVYKEKRRQGKGRRVVRKKRRRPLPSLTEKIAFAVLMVKKAETGATEVLVFPDFSKAAASLGLDERTLRWAAGRNEGRPLEEAVGVDGWAPRELTGGVQVAWVDPPGLKPTFTKAVYDFWSETGVTGVQRSESFLRERFSLRDGNEPEGGFVERGPDDFLPEQAEGGGSEDKGNSTGEGENHVSSPPSVSAPAVSFLPETLQELSFEENAQPPRRVDGGRGGMRTSLKNALSSLAHWETEREVGDGRDSLNASRDTKDSLLRSLITTLRTPASLLQALDSEEDQGEFLSAVASVLGGVIRAWALDVEGAEDEDEGSRWVPGGWGEDGQWEENGRLSGAWARNPKAALALIPSPSEFASRDEFIRLPAILNAATQLLLPSADPQEEQDERAGAEAAGRGRGRGRGGEWFDGSGRLVSVRGRLGQRDEEGEGEGDTPLSVEAALCSMFTATLAALHAALKMSESLEAQQRGSDSVDGSTASVSPDLALKETRRALLADVESCLEALVGRVPESEIPGVGREKTRDERLRSILAAAEREKIPVLFDLPQAAAAEMESGGGGGEDRGEGGKDKERFSLSFKEGKELRVNGVDVFEDVNAALAAWFRRGRDPKALQVFGYRLGCALFVLARRQPGDRGPLPSLDFEAADTSGAAESPLEADERWGESREWEAKMGGGRRSDLQFLQQQEGTGGMGSESRQLDETETAFGGDGDRRWGGESGLDLASSLDARGGGKGGGGSVSVALTVEQREVEDREEEEEAEDPANFWLGPLAKFLPKKKKINPEVEAAKLKGTDEEARACAVNAETWGWVSFVSTCLRSKGFLWGVFPRSIREGIEKLKRVKGPLQRPPPRPRALSWRASAVDLEIESRLGLGALPGLVTAELVDSLLCLRGVLSSVLVYLGLEDLDCPENLSRALRSPTVRAAIDGDGGGATELTSLLRFVASDLGCSGAEAALGVFALSSLSQALLIQTPLLVLAAQQADSLFLSQHPEEEKEEREAFPSSDGSRDSSTPSGGNSGGGEGGGIEDFVLRFPFSFSFFADRFETASTARRSVLASVSPPRVSDEEALCLLFRRFRGTVDSRAWLVSALSSSSSRSFQLKKFGALVDAMLEKRKRNLRKRKETGSSDETASSFSPPVSEETADRERESGTRDGLTERQETSKSSPAEKGTEKQNKEQKQLPVELLARRLHVLCFHEDFTHLAALKKASGKSQAELWALGRIATEEAFNDLQSSSPFMSGTKESREGPSSADISVQAKSLVEGSVNEWVSVDGRSRYSSFRQFVWNKVKGVAEKSRFETMVVESPFEGMTRFRMSYRKKLGQATADLTRRNAVDALKGWIDSEGGEREREGGDAQAPLSGAPRGLSRECVEGLRKAVGLRGREDLLERVVDEWETRGYSVNMNSFLRQRAASKKRSGSSLSRSSFSGSSSSSLAEDVGGISVLSGILQWLCLVKKNLEPSDEELAAELRCSLERLEEMRTWSSAVKGLWQAKEGNADTIEKLASGEFGVLQKRDGGNLAKTMRSKGAPQKAVEAARKMIFEEDGGTKGGGQGFSKRVPSKAARRRMRRLYRSEKEKAVRGDGQGEKGKGDGRGERPIRLRSAPLLPPD